MFSNNRIQLGVNNKKILKYLEIEEIFNITHKSNRKSQVNLKTILN